MKPYGIRYLVCYHEAMCGLPADTAGCLNVVNTLTGNAFWYDNYNEEWLQSIYCADTTLKLLDIKDDSIKYEEVDYFDNGYVSTDDLWEQRTRASLVRRYPEEFAQNLELSAIEPEM